MQQYIVLCVHYIELFIIHDSVLTCTNIVGVMFSKPTAADFTNCIPPCLHFRCVFNIVFLYNYLYHYFIYCRTFVGRISDVAFYLKRPLLVMFSNQHCRQRISLHFFCRPFLQLKNTFPRSLLDLLFTFAQYLEQIQL